MISPSLRGVIEECVPQLDRHCRAPWVVIGSAAAALAGADVEVADFDVMTSVDDAQSLKTLWKFRQNRSFEPVDGHVFRSHFARFDFSSMPVEIMGGLELFTADAWQPVRVEQVIHIDCAGVQVPVPSIEEQIRILRQFARPKDLLRSESLCAL